MDGLDYLRYGACTRDGVWVVGVCGCGVWHGLGLKAMPLEAKWFSEGHFAIA